jgi:hypothetical protein
MTIVNIDEMLTSIAACAKIPRSYLTMMNTIHPGQLVASKKVSVGNKDLSFEYAAPHGKKFICVFLEIGDSTTDIDIIQKYKELGWIPDPAAV